MAFLLLVFLQQRVRCEPEFRGRIPENFQRKWDREFESGLLQR
jgi:hypothetical protein